MNQEYKEEFYKSLNQEILTISKKESNNMSQLNNIHLVDIQGKNVDITINSDQNIKCINVQEINVSALNSYVQTQAAKLVDQFYDQVLSKNASDIITDNKLKNNSNLFQSILNTKPAQNQSISNVLVNNEELNTKFKQD